MPRDQGSGHSGAQGYTDDDTDGEADHDTAQAEECVIPERLALRRVRLVQVVHESVRGLGDRRQEYRIRDECRAELPHKRQADKAGRSGCQATGACPAPFPPVSGKIGAVIDFFSCVLILSAR